MKVKVALVVGHSERSKGACIDGVCEWDFNSTLAGQTRTILLDNPNIEPVIVYRNRGIKGLVEKLNWVIRPTLIVSMHLNSFYSPLANGTEVLHWEGSKLSGKIAMVFEKHITKAMSTRDRSGRSKAKGVSQEDRGGYLLRNTKAWCVLCEPFFVSNPTERERGLEQLDNGELAEAYANAINESVNIIRRQNECV